MLSVVGTYQNGSLKLEKNVSAKKPVKVIVTFLEEVNSVSEKRLHLSDFSFAKSQELLKDFKGSFSDTVIEERRSDL
ncbi:MAG TPA: hypothetical protein VFM79_02440 [Pelobium sp.]|nr:hypothetical protein [Pelobium sp.]